MTDLNIITHIRYTVFRVCPKDGWKIAPRYIPDHEFVLITGGSGKINIGGNEMNAKKGMLLYFHPEILHSMISRNDDPLEYYAIHFSYAKTSFINGEWIINSTDKQIFDSNVINIKNFERIRNIFDKICSLKDSNFYEFNMVGNHLFVDLYYEISKDREVDNYNYSSENVVKKSIEYIDEHINKKITVKDLSNYSSLSCDYLSRIFYEQTGILPSTYIQTAKINTAKNLMTQTDMSIKDIAYFLGFCDQFHFSKVFKKAEGFPPTTFKKILSESIHFKNTVSTYNKTSQ